MLTAVMPTIDAAIRRLDALNTISNGSVFIQPNLGGYSPIPSMQLVATEHGFAISGSPGSAKAVEKAMGKQLHWAKSNLAEFREVIADHESTMSRILRSINPFSGGNTTISEAAHASGVFQRRPMFHAGNLVFAPVTISSEIGMDAQTLLSMFSATNDAAIADAIAYWANFARSMTTLAGDLASVSSNLMSSNTGEVFFAANATMKGLAARATSIATASNVMVSHLEVLPGVRAMAVNTLSAIQAESKAIPHAAAQKAFEQAEVVSFLTGPYTAQLQTAIPRIPNLLSADASSGVTSAVTAGATVTGRSGSAQIGLSPTGMTGTMHKAAAPIGTTAVIPESPTHVEYTTAPASTAAATQSTTPTSPQPVSAAASATPTPATAQPIAPRAEMPAPFQPQAGATTTPGSINPAGAGSSATLPTTQTMSLSPTGSTQAAATPQLGASHSAGFNRMGTSNQAGLPHPAAFSAGTGEGAVHNKSLSSGAMLRGMIGGNGASAAEYNSTGRISATSGRAGLPNGNGVLGAVPSQRTGAGFSPAPSTIVPTSTGTGTSAGSAGNSAGTGNSGQRGSGLINALTHARNRPSGSATATASGLGGRRGGATESSARGLTNVATIRDNDAGSFEQNEYQRELFGDAPVTIPAVIGHNVRV